MRFEEIFSDHEGYMTKLVSGTWRIGLITPADRFTNITYLERHNQTDEVFILLKGNATLIGEEERINLEEGKIYNVPKGMWHNINIMESSVVAVVENADTSIENTDYMDFALE